MLSFGQVRWGSLLVFCVGLVATSAAPGCSPVDSSDVKTSGLYADLSAGVGPDGVGVSANLKVGPGVSADVQLTGGDQFVAYVGDQAFPMAEQTCDRCVPGIVRPHVALLPLAAASSAIRIALERAEGTSAPNSVVYLPSAHEIVSPPAGMFTSASPASRAAVKTISVTWGPIVPEDLVTVTVAGCDSNIVRVLPPGSAQLVFDLRTLTPAVASASCDVYFQVVVSRKGTVDPGYGKGGQFISSREQDALVSTAP